MECMTRYFAFVLTALLLVGCTSLANRQQTLDNSLRAYDSALRWQRYDVALALHAAPEQTQLPAHLAAIRVTGFDAGPPQLNADQLHAIRSVNIRYFHVDYQSERHLVDRQEWQFDEELDAWRITSPFPDFPYQ